MPTTAESDPPPFEFFIVDSFVIVLVIVIGISIAVVITTLPTTLATAA